MPVKHNPATVRPRSSQTIVGDQPCTTTNTPDPTDMIATIRQARYLDSKVPRVIARNRLASSTEEPSQPCSERDRSRSSDMSGSNNPMELKIVSWIAPNQVSDPILSQR